jgi:hypothetical protein
MIAAKKTENLDSGKVYQSPFETWDEKSWIRSRSLRDGEITGLPFSPNLMPLASYPAISQDSERWKTLLAYKLLGYLKFTTLLELNYVNPVTAAISAGRAPFQVTVQQRRDALRIYCDEAGHALFTEELAIQVQKTFGLHQSMLGRPRFEIALEKILEDNKSQLSPNLIKLFYVAISETLISKYLNSLPHDTQVDPLVRAVVADHADDEALHNLYYRSLFPILWNSLTCYEKEEMGKILPKLVCAFLGPDKEFEYRVLRQLGFNQDEAKGILEEVYVPTQVAQSVRKAASPTLKMFEEAGVFNIAAVEQVFMDYEYR